MKRGSPVFPFTFSALGEFPPLTSIDEVLFSYFVLFPPRMCRVSRTFPPQLRIGVLCFRPTGIAPRWTRMRVLDRLTSMAHKRTQTPFSSPAFLVTLPSLNTRAVSRRAPPNPELRDHPWSAATPHLVGSVARCPVRSPPKIFPFIFPSTERPFLALADGGRTISNLRIILLLSPSLRPACSDFQTQPFPPFPFPPMLLTMIFSRNQQ